MQGTWDNMFGFKGVNLSNVEIEIGLDPVNCAIDACLSSIGFGYNLTIGSRIAAFYGFVNIPDFEDIFLEAEISGADGMALSFRDMAVEWNNVIGDEIDLPINVNDIPEDWGFTDTFLYVAPESGTFNNINYQQGFIIETGFRVIGLDIEVDIQLTDDDFTFDLELNISDFEYHLRKELSFDYPGLSIVSVKNVTLNGLSSKALALGQNTDFYMDYHFLGHHRVAFPVPVLDLYGDYHGFYMAYLKHLFS